MFQLDNQFFKMINKIVDGFYVSLLWLVFSLPIVTFGASTTALYYTVHKTLIGNRGYIWSSFWGSFKSNFKQATKTWLLLMAGFWFIRMDYQITFAQLKEGNKMGFLCYFFVAMLIFGVVWTVYLFAYSARFENKMKETLKNTAILTIIHLPWSALIFAILVVGVVAVVVCPLLLMIVPAAMMYLYDRILERIFRKYMSEEDLKQEQEYDTIM